MNYYVNFPEVEVFHWPVPDTEAGCADKSELLVTAQAVLPKGAAKTAYTHDSALFSNSSINGVVSTVKDGSTFVPPSTYVAFGDVSAGSACGQVGQKYKSVTLGIAPAVLQIVNSKPKRSLASQ